MKTKPCPCGEENPKLHLDGDHENPKYAIATCSTCVTWVVAYRNNYCSLSSEEAMALAIEEWNAAPRGDK